MSQIAISVLRPHVIKAFIYNLTTEQYETIFGGFYPMFGIFNVTDPEIGILNVTDSAYLFNSFRGDLRVYAAGIHSFAANENSYNSLDYSRSIYNG